MNNIEKKIKILKIEPQRLPYEKEISNDLEGIQGEVEGLFECIYLDDNDIIAGPFFIVGDSQDGEFVSLTDEQIEKYTEEFGKIQEFTGEEPEAQLRMEFIGFDF